MNQVITEVVNNPLVLGACLTIGMTWVHAGLTALDKNQVLFKYAPQFHIVFLALSVLATTADLASKGQLETANLSGLQAFLMTWIPILVGGKALRQSAGVQWRQFFLGK